MLRQGQKLLQYPGVAQFLNVENVIDEELEPDDLSADILRAGRPEPATAFEVAQLKPRVVLGQGRPQSLKVLIITLHIDAQWLHMQSEHHIVRHKESTADHLVSSDRHLKAIHVNPGP